MAHRNFCLSTLLSLTCSLSLLSHLACGPEAAPPLPRQPEAVALLEQSRAAILAETAVRYRFEFAHRDAAIGWATGTTESVRVGDLANSWIRVHGQLQLSAGAPSQDFSYAVDGEQAWSLLPAEKRAEIGPIKAGGRSLGSFGVYGYLPEYLEAAPFWKELGSANSIRLAGFKNVGDVECRVVEVVWDESTQGTGAGPTRYTWYLGRDDLLPRGMHWADQSTGPQGFDFFLYDLATNVPLQRSDFQLAVPADFDVKEVARRVAVGEVSPDWQLETPNGMSQRLTALHGRVVVLEFWNTWCFICRNLLPASQRLHEDYAQQPVTVLGLNVFEASDPAQYWQERGYTFDYLLQAETVATLYDVPWQPAVVVIGPQGEVLFNQLGGSGDRDQRIRSAVEEGLGRLR